ncbi:MAG: ATP synthase F1 subunit delta [Rickettsiaceae bacterium]|nr:ATP synthase F1 subunit delta [Rickettsiaceae bacterium]MDP4832263.1 ATP synthase F1 subunit delta [Rickettsiaceae bacterium]MDP5020833.1 ATP synthase F1 subunit delta [Rickettsiaceae bacterium]MDP5083363.1 ATP synthase F1 subunit delta [Rickettsiaceae bacterium]
MSLDLKIVKSYSQALLTSAQIISKEDKVLEEVNFFAELMQENLIIRNALCSPVIEKEVKVRLVELVADKYKFESVSKQFLYVLIKNARCFLLPQIVDALAKLIATARGIKSAEVFSAFKLSAKDVEVVQKVIEAELGQKVELAMSVDSALIGGVVIKYDSNLIDCSVRGALDRIEKLATKSTI